MGGERKCESNRTVPFGTIVFATIWNDCFATRGSRSVSRGRRKKISYLRREGRGLFLHIQVENALQLIENTRTQLSLCLMVEHGDILLSTLLLRNRSGYVDDESIPL